jgi:hypothetical protein
MLIEVRLDPDALRLWQHHLIAELAALPSVALCLNPSPGRITWPRGMETLLALEDRIGGRPAGRASERVTFDTIRPLARGLGTADLVVDLAGGSAKAGDPPVLELLCDALPFETGAIAAVLSGRDALFETHLVEDGSATVLSRWRPATETPNRAGSALDMLFGRAADMLVHAVARLRKGRPPVLPPSPAPSASRDSPAAFFIRSLEGRIRTKLARQLGQAPDWHVALRRRVEGAGLPNLGPDGFQRLADDGQRFYADPFLFETGGETFLFVEEFPYATQKGILSVAKVAADGGMSKPQPVLERHDHLSYPFVFAADGAIWMIPETSARRTVELYRADRFPDRWTLHQVLIENADLADATLLRKDGFWWLFAASRVRWTSSWDALSLYRAERLTGPWHPHPGNPVQVDLASSRPGGRILDIGGRLIRPAQDCAGGYGARLAFAEIERLDEEGFQQRIVEIARPRGRNSGLHSYDRTSAFEVIDLFGPR